MFIEISYNEQRLIENACNKSIEFYKNFLENNPYSEQADLHNFANEEIKELNNLLIKLTTK